MVGAPLIEQVLERTGPFIIPAVVFAFGLVGYGLLYLYSQWHNGGFGEPDESSDDS